MRTSGWKLALSVASLLFVSQSLAGCENSSGRGASAAAVKPGPMPQNGTWSGVYFNPVFGNLHLVETKDGTVTGRWRTADGTRWGELNGETKGNVVHYEWIEHKIGMVGPMATSKGKGYFVYSRPEGDNVDDVIKGEWGMNDSETGNDWEAVKQRNVRPDPKSVQGEAEPGGPSREWK